MPFLSDLMKRFQQSEFAQGLFNSPDKTTPLDAQQLEPSVMRQLGGRLRAQYEELAGPGSPWRRGDLPGMAYQAASIINPIEGRNLAASESVPEAGLNMVPYFGPALNEMAQAQAGGRPNEATAIALEQLLNVLALKGIEGAPGAARAAGRGLEAVGNLPTVDVTGTTVSLRQLLASEHGMVPIGIDLYKGGPEAAIRSAAKPEKSFEARIRRLEKRKPDIGKQANERTVLKDSKGNDIVIGQTTPEDTMTLIRQNHKDDADIWDSAQWYEQLSDETGRHFDVENVEPYMLAFAVTQAANGPIPGIRDVLTAERLAMGHPEPGIPSANATALSEIFSGRAPSSGIGQKLSDFIDSIFGKETRTLMNDDPRYGAPSAGDRHDYRAQGYVDPAYKTWLREEVGEAAEGIKLDTPTDNPRYSGRVTEQQYERMSRNRNAEVQAFNDAKFAGHDDWNTKRVQAAAWAAKRTQMGMPKIPVADWFKEYYSQSPMELAWGENSPYSRFYPDLHQIAWEKNAAITNHVLSRIAAAAGEKLGVRVIKQEPVFGTFETYVNPNVEFTIFGTAKARQDWLESMSHAANQTAGIAYHLLPSGEGNAGVYDLMADSPLASTKLRDRAFVSKFLGELQAQNPAFNGAEVVAVDGKPTIRIVKTTPDYKPAGHFTPEELAALDGAAQAVAQTHGDGFNTKSTVLGSDLISTFNDWGVDKNGEAHTGNFTAEGRQDVISWLEGPLREQTGQWIEEGFRQHDPNTWDAHFATKSGSTKPGGKGGAGGAAAKVKPSGYNPKDLGTFSDAETLSRGWIMPDGVFVQVPMGGTHETSLSMASGASLKDVTANYPAYAAKGNLIRVVGHVGRSGYRLIAEIFKAPTDAQLRALAEWQKAQQQYNKLYDEFYFALTDPLTQQPVFQGTGVNHIRGAVQSTNFDIPF